MKIIEDLSVELTFQLSGFCMGWGFFVYGGFFPSPLFLRGKRAHPDFSVPYIHTYTAGVLKEICVQMMLFVVYLNWDVRDVKWSMRNGRFNSGSWARIHCPKPQRFIPHCI